MALDLWCMARECYVDQETGQEEDRLVQGVTSKGNQLQLFNPSIDKREGRESSFTFL
jgi:hypothetical protein